MASKFGSRNWRTEYATDKSGHLLSANEYGEFSVVWNHELAEELARFTTYEEAVRWLHRRAKK
ncbi:hypothetical protein [Amycolatopsis sp. GM8]|uniref:hypothetical protein n=1 Tax=Amycolatopsis sp. GM8 TaxID=2896530 RepID=UPI001F41C95D|nr:hypothetical protein [Amycolatopsis sp. GM8]